MANPVVTTEELVAILADATEAGNSLNGAVLNLYKSDTVPSADAVPDDFEVADFTGYVPDTAVVWGTPFVNEAGQAVVWSQAINAIAGTPILVSNTIFGWVLMNVGKTKVLAAERYDTPILIAANGRGVRVEIEVAVGPSV